MEGRPRHRLDSWKAIASHLGRSVRTARRWEAEEGLPVRRHMHRAQGSVFAWADEIDSWQRARSAAAPGVGAQRLPAAAAPDGPAAAPATLAVLPLVYLGPAPDAAYIADGFTEEVIDALSRLDGLRVISRTSTLALRGTAIDAREIGRLLGVRFLLEGTVRHDGRQLRVTTRLVDARDGQARWTHGYDGTLDDIFAIQARIAREIADGLSLRIDPRHAEERSPMLDVVAWSCLVRARQQALRWRRDALDAAVQLLEQGLATSPDHPLLLATLGRVHLHYRESGIDPGEGPLCAASQCAGRIAARWSELGTVLQLRGWIEYSSGRIPTAVHWLRQSLDRDPHDPDTLALLANCWLISGRVAQARPLIARLLAIDPLTPLTRCMPGWADLLEGQGAGAVAPYREMLAMDPGNPLARLFLVWVLVLDGRSAEAAQVIETSPPELRGSPPIEVAQLLAAAAEGDTGIATAVLSPQLERLSQATELFPRFLAHAFALAGAADRAVAWLARAADLGFINHPFLAHHDPILRALHGHPAFDALLADIERRWRAFDAGE